ncbi:MAG: RusA family crossover junction endodeoxyribonuclease [Candidatus Rokubacteria bacterium]|nr:RusA family crossover junction endodeoxyribonuclease [Candidatus Rokubacteria bacterium]
MKVEWIKVPGRPVSAQARSKQSKQSKRKHIELIKSCGQQRFKAPWNIPISVQIFYVFDRTRQNTPDLDNLDKLVLDALKSIAYLDDSQICSRKSERFYSGERVVSSAGIMPPGSELQKTAQLNREECTFIGITDALL